MKALLSLFLHSVIRGVTRVGDMSGSPESSAGAWDANDENPRVKLGDEVFCHYLGCTMKYVKFSNGSGDVAAAKGKPVGWTTTDNTVTTDYSDSIATNSSGLSYSFAGLLMAALTDGYYGWIAIPTRGRQLDSIAKVASGAALNDLLYWHTDGELTPWTPVATLDTTDQPARMVAQMVSARDGTAGTASIVWL